MAETRRSFYRRHPWFVWIAGALLLASIVATVGLAVVAHRIEPFLRTRLVAGLQDRFHTRVELDTFHVALGNGLEGEWGIWATGGGLRIWPPQRVNGGQPLDVETQSVPLIRLNEFKFHVPLRYRSGEPIHISQVRLHGLAIDVPPRSERDQQSGIQAAITTPPDTVGPSPENPVPSNQPQSGGPTMLSKVIVDRVECDDTRVVLETDKPDKLPNEFDLSQLRLVHITVGAPMDFEADLSNPKPAGIIHTTGTFGPWQSTDPGASPVRGHYRFDHADLAVFKGIAGILSSTGTYQGTLRNLVVDGDADVPDFRLTHFGHPMPLHTQFHSTVDGTDGDTWLDPVNARLGRSAFTTRGSIVRVKPTQLEVVAKPGVPSPDGGHKIDLQIQIGRGHLEDFLRLVSSSSNVLLTGDVNVKASLHIPPGNEPVHERMVLNGTFFLDQAHFTNPKVQQRIEELSLRGLGRPGDVKKTDANTIASQMRGDFHLAKALITLPSLEYTVPGAVIQLNGTYALEGGLDFNGTARMQATVSQMVGGWKGFLLKPADRFFKKDGAGTLVFVHINGTRETPQFSMDFGSNKTHPETPGRK